MIHTQYKPPVKTRGFCSHGAKWIPRTTVDVTWCHQFFQEHPVKRSGFRWKLRPNHVNGEKHALGRKAKALQQKPVLNLVSASAQISQTTYRIIENIGGKAHWSSTAKRLDMIRQVLPTILTVVLWLPRLEIPTALRDSSPAIPLFTLAIQVVFASESPEKLEPQAWMLTSHPGRFAVETPSSVVNNHGNHGFPVQCLP